MEERRNSNFRQRVTEMLRGPGLNIGDVIMLLGFAGIVVFFFYLEATSERGIAAQNQLESESKLIPLPPQTSAFDCYASHKISHAIVTCKYNSYLSLGNLAEFYDQHLKSNG